MPPAVSQEKFACRLKSTPFKPFAWSNALTRRTFS
jgi:hypothetical protein